MQHHYPASESPTRPLDPGCLGAGVVAGAGAAGVAAGDSNAPLQGPQDCCFPDWLPNFSSPMKEMEGK